jgi:hypothetical protein
VTGAARANQSPEIPVALSQEPKPVRLSPLSSPYSLTTAVAVSLGASRLVSDPRTIQFVGVSSFTKS